MLKENRLHKNFRQSDQELRSITCITRWRAAFCARYYLVIGPEQDCRVEYDLEEGYWRNDKDWLTGNYFETEEEARAVAAIIMNRVSEETC